MRARVRARERARARARARARVRVKVLLLELYHLLARRVATHVLLHDLVAIWKGA